MVSNFPTRPSKVQSVSRDRVKDARGTDHGAVACRIRQKGRVVKLPIRSLDPVHAVERRRVTGGDPLQNRPTLREPHLERLRVVVVDDVGLVHRTESGTRLEYGSRILLPDSPVE